MGSCHIPNFCHAGARLAFGGKELQNHTVPKVYGAIEPTAVFVPLKEILRDDDTFKTVTTEVFGPLQVWALHEVLCWTLQGFLLQPWADDESAMWQMHAYMMSACPSESKSMHHGILLCSDMYAQCFLCSLLTPLIAFCLLRKLFTYSLALPLQVLTEYDDSEVDTVLQVTEKMHAHLTAAIVSNDVHFLQKVLANTLNVITYSGIRAISTGTLLL